jgi:hypothetical protein
VPRKHPEYVQMILRETGFEGCRTLIAGKGFSTMTGKPEGKLITCGYPEIRDGATRVTRTLRFDFKPPAKWLAEPVLRRTLQRDVEHELRCANNSRISEPSLVVNGWASSNGTTSMMVLPIHAKLRNDLAAGVGEPSF